MMNDEDDVEILATDGDFTLCYAPSLPLENQQQQQQQNSKELANLRISFAALQKAHSDLLVKYKKAKDQNKLLKHLLRECQDPAVASRMHLSDLSISSSSITNESVASPDVTGVSLSFGTSVPTTRSLPENDTDLAKLLLSYCQRVEAVTGALQHGTLSLTTNNCDIEVGDTCHAPLTVNTAAGDSVPMFSDHSVATTATGNSLPLFLQENESHADAESPNRAIQPVTPMVDSHGGDNNCSENGGHDGRGGDGTSDMQPNYSNTVLQCQCGQSFAAGTPENVLFAHVVECTSNLQNPGGDAASSELCPVCCRELSSVDDPTAHVNECLDK